MLGNVTFDRHARLPLVWSVAALVVTTLIVSQLYGQEVALPEATPSEQATPVPAATAASPASAVPSPELIPSDVLPMPDASPLPGAATQLPSIEQLNEELKPKPLSKAAENFRMKIEWRKLRNQAQNDPAVKAAHAAADRAHTDLERRKLLAKYFNAFFDKMIALGPPEMRQYLNARRLDQLRSLPQARVRPLTAAEAAATKKATEREGSSGTSLDSVLAAPSPSPTASASLAPRR